MARGKHYKAKRHSLVGGLIRLLLLVVFVYAVVLGVSAFGIYQSYQTAAPAFNGLEDSIVRVDIGHAKQDAEVAASAIADIDNALDGMQWEIARYIPVVGEDVDIARDASALAYELVNDALLPVLEGANGVTSNVSELDIVGTLTSTPGAMNAITSAREVLTDCKTRAAALPTSHFPFINAVSDKLREVTSESLGRIDALTGVLGMAGTVVDILT